ncbi:MAG: glycosyltransferase family 9 protein, partial [Bdellovibrionaceae bacterium]|nr:glycosyltransferase family 9 protein [Pseudobdellovibrionaceae bacterium]
MKKAFLIRLDKIGDLVCTLPVDEHPSLQGWDVLWVIQKGIGFVAEASKPKRKYVELDKSNPASSSKDLRRLLQEYQPELAVSFQSPWWVNFALWRERVPIRAGVLSQWHSYLFLNKGLRQKRSLAEKHESEYNYELMSYALDSTSDAAPVLKLQAPEEALPFLPESYVIVHPGMAGSARNIPQFRYLELIRSLAKTENVVITGTDSDLPFLNEIKNQALSLPRVFWLVGKLSPVQLLSALNKAKHIYSPSTGIAHLAASLDRPVTAWYSPIRVQSSRRWGPRGAKVQIIEPQVICPEAFRCSK